MLMPNHYVTFLTSFGTFTIIWSFSHPSIQIQHIFLSTPTNSSDTRARTAFPNTTSADSPHINKLVDAFRLSLQGHNIDFDLTLLNWDLCTPFQQSVLRAEASIPRGYVSTYQRIARHIDTPHGARAVGNALARNPFPIIIPCHRAIRTDGSLGGYQGGTTMKRTLLEKEGIRFTPSGKVAMTHIYY